MKTFKVTKLFQKTLFGIIATFGLIGLATSSLSVYTVDTHLSEEYVTNSRDISKAIANASVDILLNRDLATLQSVIDQYLEIQGIKYVYITDETGEFLAHTFIPGVPDVIANDDPSSTATVERNIPGLCVPCVEVGSSILAGVAGTVHVGMDTSLIALKIQRAIGRQAFLIFVVFVVCVFAALWFVNMISKPLADVLAYAVELAENGEQNKDGKDGGDSTADDSTAAAVLERKDELGDLARLMLFLARGRRIKEDAAP